MSMLPLNYPEIGRALMYANTVGYLWRKLRTDSSILDLGRKYTPDELNLLLVNLLSKEEKTPTEELSLYAVVAAISFQKFPGPLSPVTISKLSVLQWMQPFFERWKDERMTPNFVIKEVPGVSVAPKVTQY